MAIAVAAGFSAVPILILAVIVAVAWAFRSIYISFYLGIFLIPFLGIIISIPTGNIAFGQRAFGGSIDVSLAEVVFFCVLIAWALRMLFFWWRRRDQNWRPHFPLLWAYLPLIVAHALSVFSPLEPDPYPVLKFALRPVAFDYFAFIALPINLIKSRRRLRAALGAFAAVGVFAAANGLLAMFFPQSGFLGRARPMDIFGVAVLGGNYNVLAELLVATAPATLALAYLVHSARFRRLLTGAAVFQCMIGLFTFTRTAWIVFILEAIFLGWTIWRDRLHAYASALIIGLIVLLPFGIGMVAYSFSSMAKSSDSTRLMLSQIALQVFESSPIVGGGAGTFINRIGSTQVFLIEYGAPLDSHGFLQKIAAETGLLGLGALIIFIFLTFQFVRTRLRWIHRRASREVILLLITGTGGVFVYELFNTSYWTGKMWLPLGLLIAAIGVLGEEPTVSEPPPHATLKS